MASTVTIATTVTIASIATTVTIATTATIATIATTASPPLNLVYSIFNFVSDAKPTDAASQLATTWRNERNCRDHIFKKSKI